MPLKAELLADGVGLLESLGGVAVLRLSSPVEPAGNGAAGSALDNARSNLAAEVLEVWQAGDGGRHQAVAVLAGVPYVRRGSASRAALTQD